MNPKLDPDEAGRKLKTGIRRGGRDRKLPQRESGPIFVYRISFFEFRIL